METIRIGLLLFKVLLDDMANVYPNFHTFAKY